MLKGLGDLGSLRQLRVRRGRAFTPDALFAAGGVGDYGSADDLTRLWQDTAGTTPVTTSGQPVARQDGARGVISLRQGTDLQRPAYTASGGLHALAFGGTDDGLASAAALDLTGTDAVTVILGMRKASDAAVGIALELSANTNGNGGFYLSAPQTVGGANYAFRSAGTLNTQAVAAGFAAPHTAVLTGQADISADSNILRVNGVQVDANNNDQGTGNYGVHTLYMGRRGLASLPLNGEVYAWIVIGRLLSAAELAQAEAWVAAKSGFAVPVNTAAPAISGTAQSGQTLTASTGTWSGLPSSYAYQWYRNGVAISGATASTYAVQAGDVGSTITVSVTASNMLGAASASSAATATITEAPAYAIQGRIADGSSTSRTSHPITLPSGIVAGELLIAIVAFSGAPGLGMTPTGWNLLNTQTVSTSLKQAWYWKIATGSDALTVTTDVAATSSWNAFRVTGYGYAPTNGGGVPFSGGNNAVTTSTPPDPPASPPMTYFGYTVARPFLFIPLMSKTSGPTTAAPTGYSNHIVSPAGPPTSSADRMATTLSEDPGAFAGPSSPWAGVTFVIFPA